MKPLCAALSILMLLGAACGDRKPGKQPARTAPSTPAAGRPAQGGIRIVKLQVRDRTSPNDQVVRFKRSDLRRIVREQVSAQPGFVLQEGGGSGAGPAHRLRLDIELQALVGSEKGKAAVLVAAQMDRIGAPADEPGYLRNTVQEKVYVIAKLRSLRHLYLELLQAGIAEVLRGMGLEGRLRGAPARVVIHAIKTARVDELDQGWTGQVDVWQPALVPGQLTLQGDLGLPGLAATLLMGWSAPASVSAGGLDVRELAIKIAAVRRLASAVPALTALLQRERRRRIRDLCLGALAEIRDPRAVPALTRYTQGGNEARLRKVIGVLGQIGGAEAEAFLEMTADSHTDEEVQKLARETLDRLKKGRP